MTTDYSEKEILQRLAKNERQAVETIYKENYNMVQHLIINNNGSADDARDIFQEAMIVLYENAKSPAFELTCQVKTYLYSVSRRLWLKRLQQVQKFSTDVEGIGETIPIEEEVEAHEQRNVDLNLMEKAMLNLGEPCRSLIEAYYLQKKNMTDIASAFGYTNADNAKNQKYKCLMRLKKIFFSQYKTKEEL